MIITRDNEEEVSVLKRQLIRESEMKDLGNTKYFLEIEVLSSNNQSLFLRKSTLLNY